MESRSEDLQVSKPARAKINFKTGEVELESSEQFMRDRLASIDVIAEYMVILSTNTSVDDESIIEQEEIAIVAEEEEKKLSTIGEQELQISNTFGELFHQFRNEVNDLEEALITAFYVQKQSPQNDFKTSEVNNFLKEHGVKLSNPSGCLNRLASKKLLFQTRKDGNLKYMRVSSDGVNHLKSLRR